MRSKFKWIYALLLVFTIQLVSAQEKTVTGVVSDGTGSLPGVNVIVKGTKKSAQTNMDGRYSVQAAPGDVLMFSFVGMNEASAIVGSSNTINVKMQTGVSLGEVVIQGYGITKTKTTSNVASVTVSSDIIEARPNASFIQTLQSRVSGLNIASGSGQPGANSTIILRGTGSITGKIEPLFVIDGIALESDNFRSLNPDDIASVSVLKDAGATSIYGNRGANGVIIVTTKKGSFNSPLKVKFSSTVGFTTLQKTKYDLMDSQQLLTTERLYGKGRGFTGGVSGAPMTDAEIAAVSTTDWTEYFFRTGISKNNVLSLTSGSKNMTAFTSIAYFDQQGILVDSDLKRFNFRNNLSGKSNDDKFTYSTNSSINFSRRNEPTSIGTGGINRNFVLGANNGVPYLSPDDYSTSAKLLADYRADGTLLRTPLMLVDKLKTFKNVLDELKGLVNLEGGYKLSEDLTLGTSLGVDYTQETGYRWQNPISFNSLLFATAAVANDNETHSFDRRAVFTSNTKLIYNHVFDEKHTVNAAAYIEYIKSHRDGFGFVQNGLNPKTSSPGAGTGYVLDGPANDRNVPNVFAYKLSAGLFSYFATADYDYDGKYGFGAAVRRDASSRFASSFRWGTFYSLSGRWNIDKEDFMEGSGFDSLKLRGSYGTSGNQDVSDGTFLALNNTKELYTTQVGYNGTQAFVLSQLAVPDLRWEKTAQANIGLDFAFANSRLTGSFDVYRKKTEDLFIPVPLSAINASGSINSNFGSLENEGIEATLAYDVLTSTNGFNLSFNFNGSYNKNTITDIAGSTGRIDNGNTVIEEGRIINEYYLTKYEGINPANGNLLFTNANGDLTENPDPLGDRSHTGKSRIPVYQGGFGFDSSYKGFFLTSNFSFTAQVYRIDYDLAGLLNPSGNVGIFNLSSDLLNAWTPDNRITNVASLKATNFASDNNSDRFLVDASYVRLRFVSFGYDVPKKMLERSPFKSFRVFMQAENLVTFSKWRGWDAESPRAADQYQYPTPKIVSVGLQLEF